MQRRVMVMAALLLGVSVAGAQEFRATLQGTVLDPNNAVVPGAEVTLRNAATAVERQSETDAEGHYLFQFLPPGRYSLTTRLQGFRTETIDSIELSLGQNLNLDVTLTLGETAESVVVTADVAAVETETSVLGSLVTRDIIDTLPLKGHGSLTMFTMASGIMHIQAGNKFSEDVRPIDQTNNVGYSMSGSPNGTGDVSMDGIASVVDIGRGMNISSFVPATDAVQEFRMQAGTLPAEYGRSSGTIMNLVIKSGTNEVHGSLYDHLRNAALDANLFFNNVAGRELPVYQVQLFGGSLGGPIYLPKLYNGRNRSFFFVNYEGTRQKQATSSLLNLPTTKMRNGDFSEYSAAIYNPFSTKTVDGSPTRDPFPGNQIPKDLWDPVGQNVMDYWPEPNSVPSGSPWVRNYAEGTKYRAVYDTVTVKFDHTVSPKGQMFVRISTTPTGLVEYPFTFTGIAVPSRADYKRPGHGVALSYTHLFGARAAMDIRAGWNRAGNSGTTYSTLQGFDPMSLGFSQSYGKLVEIPGFPTFSFNDGINGLGGSDANTRFGDSWNTSDSVTFSAGRHTFKAGGEFRLSFGNYGDTPGNGSFSFRTNETGGPVATTPKGGSSVASLLLGFGSGGSIPSGGAISYASQYYALYFQDDFRVNSKLTLNLGLRWELETPRTERFDRMVRGFDYTAASPLNVPGLDLRGGLVYANVGGLPRGLYDTDSNNFAPRVGFAYSLDQKTVVRGGYALSYIPIVTNPIDLGFRQNTPWVTTTDGGITVTNRLSDPFPEGKLPPTGNSAGLATLVGQGVSYAEPSDTFPEFHNWQISVQRALRSKAVLEVAYIGSRGTHLKSPSLNQNQVPYEYFPMGSDLTKQAPNPFYGVITSGSLSGKTVQQAQLLRPYPHFTGVTRVEPAYGSSNYHSLQVKLEKRMANGLAALVAYTASKNISTLHSPQNIYDRTIDRALADLDVPSRLTTAFSYEIPVGRGRPFLTGVHRAADLLIGGWQVAGSFIFQGGQPLTFGVTGGTYVGNAIRPNLVGDPRDGVAGISHAERLGKYFNTAAFERPANFTIGNLAPRIGSVRSPGNNTINMSLSKYFEIVEGVRVEFRATAYNFPNHPVFSAPNTTVGSGGFGTIGGQANLSRQVEFLARIIF